MDKIVIFIIAIIILAGVGFWAFESGFFVKQSINPTTLPKGIVLFFGADCPHCKIVEDFIAQNNISQKVSFSNLEVPFNGKTSAELISNAETAVKSAQYCKIDVANGLSIPFLWDGNNLKCYLGQEEVINFFKNEAGIK